MDFIGARFMREYTMHTADKKHNVHGSLRVASFSILLILVLTPLLEAEWAPCGHAIGVGNNCSTEVLISTDGSAPASLASSADSQCGNNMCCTTTAGNPIDLWNGREFFTHTDLVLPGLMDISIQRSYDSQAQYDSALGYGWALNYFMRLYEYADGSVILRRECGVRRPFVYDAGAYQTPAGETGTLVKNVDESWTYWEKSGEAYHFDIEGKLTEIVSPQGPKLAFSYDSRGKLPLIGLSPYAVDPGTPREIAQEFRLIQIDEYDGSAQATGRWVSLNYDEGTGRLTGLNDSAGRTVQYVHDTLGNLEQVFLPENETQTFAYQDPNDPHNATTLTHRGCPSCGTGTIINTYNADDRVIRQEHGMHVINVSYDIPYVQTTVTEKTYDDQGVLLHTAVEIVEFNELGNALVETDPLGNQIVYTRDSRMNITRKEIWEDQGGPELVLVYAEDKTYDAQDNVLTYTEAAGFPEERTTTYTYDTYGRLETISVPSVVNAQENKVTTFTYDGNDNLLTRTEQGYLGDGTPFAYTTTYTYTSNGQVETIDRSRTDVSDVTTYAYDTQGNLTSVTQPLNLVTSYSNYTATGQPQTVTDPNNVDTTYTYDSLGRVRSVTVDGDTTSYTYTPTGKIEQITLPRQNTVAYSYDSFDRLETITDGLGNTINYTYDSSGNRLKEDIRDPQQTLTKTVSYQYDVLGRLYRVNNPDSNYWEYSYDAIGNRLSSKDPKGNPLTYSYYDPLGRLEEVVQPGDIHTLYDYDAHDNLLNVTDGNGNPTTYVFDDMGRVYQEISSDTGTTTHHHDPAGNVISETDAKGVTVNYTYDALNRLTLVDFPTDADIVYTYDTCTYGKGRRCQVQDQAGTITYAYSVKGELVQEDRLVLGTNYTTGYQYDDNGNLQILTYPSGRTVSYVYDNADQATSVLTTPAGGAQQTAASSISYYPFGSLSSMTYGNGLVRTVGYDLQYRMTSILTGTVEELTYIPDANDNIQDIVDNLDSNKSRSFSYDALNRLQGATGPWGNLTWTYDNVGNRMSYVASGGSTNYTYYTSTNRLEALSGAMSASFSYDPNGNTESDGVRQYTYADNNRLLRITDTAVVAEYMYNVAGQRVAKIRQPGTTIFHYDQVGLLIGESTGTEFDDYIYLHDRPLGKASGSTVFYIHADHLGTPMIMTDQSTVSVWTVEFKPFGEGAVVTGSQTLNLRFPGQYYDEEIDLHYNYFRYYSPQLGRYITADPSLSFHAAPSIPFRLPAELPRPQGLHPFVYGENNAITFSDPTGLAIWICNRKARGVPGNHAYFWDDRNRQCCGMGSTQLCKETGPSGPPPRGGDFCRKVPGSTDREDDIMKCCKDTADKGPWLPKLNDCHQALDYCLKEAKLDNPGAPGGRMGKPCDPCDQWAPKPNPLGKRKR
jgi:RHS repeat-associated protein